MMRVHKQAFATLRWYSHTNSKRKSTLATVIARLRVDALVHAFNAMRTYAFKRSFKRIKVAEVLSSWNKHSKGNIYKMATSC